MKPKQVKPPQTALLQFGNDKYTKVFSEIQITIPEGYKVCRVKKMKGLVCIGLAPFTNKRKQ